ncbi:DUF2868 domain-containing protein [Rubrivivax sp. RP6-9]|uniref:DUF2868 domain-containing protein n=1 Tax=Rubrivivax sp. RP6-9 TaxID=3415750 RepID=UPI003CC51058
MTEHEARQVLLLQSHETAGPTAVWTAEDRAWATQQAVATAGDRAPPERFVAVRAALALPRLLPRDRAAQRWMGRRAWHPAWVLLALLGGLAAGMAVDQLGPPQRVNLLAPAVWAVVAWNLLVYAALLLPLPTLGLRRWAAGLARAHDDGPGGLWARHAAPLSLARAGLVMHVGAAALALGLVTGLYLRGLVLDYRAGWQSTFLEPPAVQALLGTLLAPASAVTGIAVADVGPLRVAPGAAATASAAPWIHLYAATLVLGVVLPRLLLALFSALRAGALARRFPLSLDTPYFEALHPLMRPGLPRAVRLLWVGGGREATLLGQAVGPLTAPLTLLRSDEGDELQLDPVPAVLDTASSASVATAAAPAPGGWWQRLWSGGDPAEQALQRLRDSVDAVLLLTTPETPRPPWLATLARPVVVLLDGPAAGPQQLSLHALADGWLPDGRLLQALAAALDADPRLVRLADSWTRRQQARLDAITAELAGSLARSACARAPVADDGFLARRAEADAARAALATMLAEELQAGNERLAALLGRAAPAASAGQTLPAVLHSRVGEGRAALMGGVVTGALAGLKADVLSGGLTMGAGALAGGLLGALGAAGVARGLNVVRGTDRSHAAWDDEALAAIARTLLLRALVQAHGLEPEAALARLAPALAAQQRVLAAAWAVRGGKGEPAAAEAAVATMAAALQPVLAQVLKTALAAPAYHPAP